VENDGRIQPHAKTQRRKVLIFKIITENEISKHIVDIAYCIHSELGPELLESVYEEIMCYELAIQGLKVERQKPIPVVWDELKMDIGFRTNLISYC